jgi:hypothetical protein
MTQVTPASCAVRTRAGSEVPVWIRARAAPMRRTREEPQLGCTVPGVHRPLLSGRSQARALRLAALTVLSDVDLPTPH